MQQHIINPSFPLNVSGFRYHEDKLDGYSFFYPEDWQPVTTSGNDVFYRNPFNVEENLFVDVSSPSSSTYASVEALGSPAEVAQRTKNQVGRKWASLHSFGHAGVRGGWGQMRRLLCGRVKQPALYGY
jgi:hypothetical protein